MSVASVRVTQILSGITAGASTVAELPQRLVAACARSLPVTGVGLILTTADGPIGTVAVTDGVAGVLEELQFSLGEGPGVEASASGRPVLVPDLAGVSPARWPGFSAGVAEASVRSIFAFPLRVGGIRVGVLDLYRDRVGALTEDELTEALSFADAATLLLLDLQAGTAGNGAAVATIPLLADRAEVHQATGMITVLAKVTLMQALSLLRARAYASGRPVSDVARDVLAGVEHITDDRSGHDG